jgi:hypothetical protein
VMAYEKNWDEDLTSSRAGLVEVSR